MTDFCVQLQPERAGNLDLDRVCADAEQLAGEEATATRFAVVRGEGYVNLMFSTREPAALWSVLWRRLYHDPAFGVALRDCSMVVCEGEHGWDDYRLLHHFDPEQSLDTLPAESQTKLL